MNTKNELTNMFTNTKSYVKEKINTTNIKAKLENTKNELKDLGTSLTNALNQNADNQKPKQQKCHQISKEYLLYFVSRQAFYILFNRMIDFKVELNTKISNKIFSETQAISDKNHVIIETKK